MDKNNKTKKWNNFNFPFERHEGLLSGRVPPLKSKSRLRSNPQFSGLSLDEGGASSWSPPAITEVITPWPIGRVGEHVSHLGLYIIICYDML